MTTMAEPEWDEQTRNLALAYDAVERCGVCGGPAVLCQDPATQFAWKAGDPIRCHRATAVAERQKDVTEETNPHVHALVWPVVLREEGLS